MLEPLFLADLILIWSGSSVRITVVLPAAVNIVHGMNQRLTELIILCQPVVTVRLGQPV
jgi:hypothetical protein